MMHRMQLFLITWRALVNYSQFFCVHVHENLSLTVSRYTGNNNSERSVFSNDDQQVMTHHCSSRTEDGEIPSRKTRPLEEMWPTGLLRPRMLRTFGRSAHTQEQAPVYEQTNPQDIRSAHFLCDVMGDASISRFTFDSTEQNLGY